MEEFKRGEIVETKNGLWVVVCPPEGDTDLLIAALLPTDEEVKYAQLFRKIAESGKREAAPPPFVKSARSVLAVEEVTNRTGEIIELCI